MKLFERDQIGIACADCRLERCAISRDVFTTIPVCEAEIEDALARKSAGAAGTRAESVNEPRELLERSKLENLYAVRGLQRPGRGDFRTRGRSHGGFAGNAADSGSFGGSRHHLSIIATGMASGSGRREIPPSLRSLGMTLCLE